MEEEKRQSDNGVQSYYRLRDHCRDCHGEDLGESRMFSTEG